MTSLGSHGADVLGFLALAARTDLELDGLALRQGSATGLKVGDVHEHVLATLPGDESKPSVLIEELHFALHNGTNCLSRLTQAVGRHWTVRASEARSSFGRGGRDMQSSGWALSATESTVRGVV